MDIISTTVKYEGYPIKVENGKVFLPAFGTTYYDNSMAWRYKEVKVSSLKRELYDFLKEKKLI